MNFTKSKQGGELGADRAVAARLTAIASRGRGEGAAYPGCQPLETPRRIQRRFWTPDELGEH